MTLAVEAMSISKRYERIVAVDDVSLRVEQGEIHGLLGPNGAGKTTLMRMLFALIRPDAGDIQVFGRSVAHDGVHALRDVAGFIESPRFYSYLSGRRNLALLARLDLDQTSQRRIDEVLDRTGLLDRSHDKVRGYSFGMQQRLGLAAALLRSPKLLVVDEPSNGLDPGGIRDMRQLIRDLADSGLTILLSSHNMLEVNELCDHATIMRRGRVAFHGSMRELKARAPEPGRKIVTANDAHAAGVLGAVAGVSAVQLLGDGVRFTASAPVVEQASIMLGQEGIGISSLTALEAPLDTLFFQLTGEATPDTIAA